MGKKRIFEENSKNVQSKNNINNIDTNNKINTKNSGHYFFSTNSSALNINKNNSSSCNNKKKITEEISSYYNMTRSICLSHVQTKNKKYTKNSFIPCIPFSFPFSQFSDK